MEGDELAKALIGRPGRLRLARWLLSRPAEDFFFQHEAVIGTGDVQSEVKDAISHFEQVGIVEKVERNPGASRRQYYRTCESPIWRVYEATAAAVDELSTDPELEVKGSVDSPAVVRRSHGR